MWKALFKFLSDVCSTVGAKRLALRFLMMSLETINVEVPIIHLANSKTISLPTGPFDMKVIYEDKDLIRDLGDLRTNDLMIAKHINDIN